MLYEELCEAIPLLLGESGNQQGQFLLLSLPKVGDILEDLLIFLVVLFFVLEIHPVYLQVPCFETGSPQQVHSHHGCLVIEVGHSSHH